MSVPIALATVVLLAVVLVVVSAPVRAAKRLDATGSQKGKGDDDGDALSIRAELETARDAKYREIRDAELDYRTGKLSREDHEAVDRTLRAEAIEILNRLEAPEQARDAAARRDAPTQGES